MKIPPASMRKVTRRERIRLTKMEKIERAIELAITQTFRRRERDIVNRIRRETRTREQTQARSTLKKILPYLHMLNPLIGFWKFFGSPQLPFHPEDNSDVARAAKILTDNL